MKLADFFRIQTSESIPPDEIWFVTPGEEIEVVRLDGSSQRVTVREPRVDKIVNIGLAE